LSSGRGAPSGEPPPSWNSAQATKQLLVKEEF
jgi:hypothetical protein